MPVEIRIDKKTGEVMVEGLGYRGTECLKPLDEVTEVISARVLRRKRKPEMYLRGHKQPQYTR